MQSQPPVRSRIPAPLSSLLLATGLALFGGCQPADSTPAQIIPPDASMPAAEVDLGHAAMPDLARLPDLVPPDAGTCDPQAYPNTLYATGDTLLGQSSPSSLCRYRGKVLLIFNAAELCGFTFETAGLQNLQENYGPKGFEVLGFYSDDFGNQGGDPAACNAKFHVTFDTFEIAPVTGANARPPYKWIFAQKNPGPEPTTEPQWNFSKYLIGRDGKLVAHWAHGTTPDVPEIATAIESEIAKAPPK